MQALLGKALLNSLKPRDKPFEVRDTRTTGLILRVQPSGTMTYYLEFKRGRRIRIGPSSLPADDARAIATEHLSAVYKGKDPAKVQNQAKGLTFLGFIEAEYEPWAKQHLRTYAKTIQRLKSNCERFSAKALHEITPQEYERWRSKRLAAGKARSTANRDLDDLRSVLSKAEQWGFVEVNPLAKVKKLKVDTKGSVRFLTDEEEVRLTKQLDEREEKMRSKRDRANEWREVRDYSALPSLRERTYADHLKPMVIVSLNTGIRQGELFDLMWADVDLRRRSLTIRGEKSKNLQTRHIPLNERAWTALRDWHSQADEKKGRVFSSSGGDRFDNVKSAWKSLLADSEIERFRWHDMRHTFASRLVMKGVDLNTVRELMGHADYQMTLRYSHLAPEHKANAVAKLLD
jgi:integrase